MSAKVYKEERKPHNEATARKQYAKQGQSTAMSCGRVMPKHPLTKLVIQE